MSFLSIKESWKKKKTFYGFHKNIKQHNCFHHWNVFEQQISRLEWFLKDHVTEDWSNDAENSAFLSQELITF